MKSAITLSFVAAWIAVGWVLPQSPPNGEPPASADAPEQPFQPLPLAGAKPRNEQRPAPLDEGQMQEILQLRRALGGVTPSGGDGDREFLESLRRAHRNAQPAPPPPVAAKSARHSEPPLTPIPPLRGHEATPSGPAWESLHAAAEQLDAAAARADREGEHPAANRMRRVAQRIRREARLHRPN